MIRLPAMIVRKCDAAAATRRGADARVAMRARGGRDPQADFPAQYILTTTSYYHTRYQLRYHRHRITIKPPTVTDPVITQCELPERQMRRYILTVFRDNDNECCQNGVGAVRQMPVMNECGRRDCGAAIELQHNILMMIVRYAL